MTTYIDLDEWIDEQYLVAFTQSHNLILEAFRWHEQARRNRLTNPQQAADSWGKAAECAALGNQPCLSLFFQTRQSTAYAYWLGDYRTGLDLAARLVADMRKYAHCATASMVYRNAISMHLAVDPIGYEAQIEEMFAYVERHVTLDYSRRCLLQYDRIELALALDDIETALRHAETYLELCYAHPRRFQTDYMGAGALEMLGRLYALRGEWDKTLEYVQASEKFARVSDNTTELINVLYWQALIAYRQDRTSAGDQHFAAAETQRLQIEHRTRPYFELLTQLYLLRGEGNLIPPLMDDVILTTRRGGELYGECLAWLTYARCLGKLGKSVTPAIEGAQQAAQRLLKPASFLAKVERVIQGDYADEWER